MATAHKSTKLQTVSARTEAKEPELRDNAPSQLPRSIFSPEIAKTWDLAP